MPLALLSVSDKTGLPDFAAQLLSLGYDLVSTGGTLEVLRDAGLAVRAVADVTGHPEMLSGRVKTLHPTIHAGILAPREDSALAELSAQQIETIDIVVVNLYPFRETVARGAGAAEVVENIDIGGPTMLRAAAKNYTHVLPVCDPQDYERVADLLAQGLSDDDRRDFARKAFAHTAAYDAAIVSWFDRDSLLPESLHLTLEHAQSLRYGENPHQQAARYREQGRRGFWDEVIQHSGMALSYLNLFDSEAAWQLVNTFTTQAAVIVKHANPCGVALGETLHQAYEKAYACDAKSAFGGIVAFNGAVDDALADQILANAKADVIIAPAYAPGVAERMAKKRKNTRLLEAPRPRGGGLGFRVVDAGFLVQEQDSVKIDRQDWQVVSAKQPDEESWRDIELAWRVCARTTSNAIVFVKDLQALAVASGQQSRVDAVALAAQKAAGRALGGVCASDAFFPFADGIEAAAAAGITSIIQPGGSVNDDKVIKTVDALGLSMVFTGKRHFLH